MLRTLLNFLGDFGASQSLENRMKPKLMKYNFCNYFHVFKNVGTYIHINLYNILINTQLHKLLYRCCNIQYKRLVIRLLIWSV